MYGMYVQLFQINKISYQSWSDRSARGNVKHVYVLVVCSYNVYGVLPCQLNMALDNACWKMQKEAFVTLWKENYQNTRIVNEQMVLNNALCIEILMIYWIINLHNHMHFVRYLDVFTIHSGALFPLIVLIHVTWIDYKKYFSNQWLYFLVSLYRIFNNHHCSQY